MANQFITVVGLKGAIRYMRNVELNGIRVSRRASLDMAGKLKKRVKSEIEKLPHYSSPGHNTPTSLMSYLRGPEQVGGKSVKGYQVYMAQESEGTTRNLPLIVERGAKPHYIPITLEGVRGNPESGTYHPGFVGRKYWEKGVINFLNADFEGEMRKSAEELIRGKE